MKKIILIIPLILLGCMMLKAQVFDLPTLPYAFNSLEPYIDAQTMEIHYTKHHKTYVDNLNKSVAEQGVKDKDIYDLLLNADKYGNSIRNNGGGHYNHTLFWDILSPNPQKQPTGNLLEMINRDFGGVENLKNKINDAALARFGSGWAWLVLTKDMKLIVTSTPNQDNPIMKVSDVRGFPILGIDVWEHAYYLKYQNKRADYLNSI